MRAGTADDAGRSATRAADDVWSFHCSACGKCCNSPPQLSVPELLHHQHRFIGCLAIRRIPRVRPGDRLGPLEVRASEADCIALSALADAILHRLPDGDSVLLATHGFGVDASEPCPALGSDMRCTIHGDRKPAACSAVPLDALLPDRLQHAVLAERSAQAAYMGADCIVRGTRRGSLPVTQGNTVADDARAALARRRRDLADEKQRWGHAVFGILRGELFASPSGIARVPANGFLVTAIAPVLVVLAAASPASRRRCLEYIDAQVALIERRLCLAARESASTPTTADPRRGAGTAQLQAFARTHRALRSGLERAIA